MLLDAPKRGCRKVIINKEERPSLYNIFSNELVQIDFS